MSSNAAPENEIALASLVVKDQQQQQATAPPEEADDGPLDLRCITNAENGRVLISVIPPEGPVSEPSRRIPLDVCCVIDISGSMGSEATVQDDKGTSETFGLSLLDVVKHATRTVGGLLGPNDRLSVVTFSDNGKTVLPLTLMNDAGKKNLDTVCSTIKPDGMTNLWDGLHTGMELLRNRDEKDTARNAAVLILTDGQPNVEPPRGHIPTLERYMDQFNGTIPFTVSTFGFGYNLDSTLLNAIATKTGGSYVFIPDSGLVGTVFVNTMANILCTVATTVTLAVECDRPITHADPNLNVTSFGANASLGTVQFGQERNVAFHMGPATKLSAEPPVVRVTYMHKGTKYSKLVTARLATEAKENAAIDQHVVRSIFATYVTKFVDGASPQDLTSLGKAIRGVSNAVLTLPMVAALLEDVKGEVTKAITDNGALKKWGRHYLPSLVRATLMQQCNNFKDHSVQLYGGALFKALRDEGEKIFTKIAPPKPSVQPAARPGCAAAAPAAPVSMTRFYNRGGGCVLGSCKVAMADGSSKPAAMVRPGDVVSGGGCVRCVVKIRIDPATPMVTFAGGLSITQYHPICLNGRWEFPVNVAGTTATVANAPFVYTYVLHRGAHSLIVDGIEVVTLGHGLSGSVVEHEYLGTERVIEDLALLPGFADGCVTVGGFQRDPLTLRIAGITAAAVQSIDRSVSAPVV